MRFSAPGVRLFPWLWLASRASSYRSFLPYSFPLFLAVSLVPVLLAPPSSLAPYNAANPHVTCSAICPPHSMPTSADADIADQNKAGACRHFVFKPQDPSRHTANDVPVVADRCAAWPGPTRIVIAGDVKTDRFAETDRQILAGQRTDVHHDTRVDRGTADRSHFVIVSLGSQPHTAARETDCITQRVDVLDQMHDALAGVERVELVVTAAGPTGAQVGIGDRRVVQKSLIQAPNQCAVEGPKVLPVFRSFSNEYYFGDLTGCVSLNPPFAILVLRIAQGHVRIGSDEGSPSIVTIGHQHFSWKSHPRQSVFRDRGDVDFAGVVELGTGSCACPGDGGHCASKKVVPVVEKAEPAGASRSEPGVSNCVTRATMNLPLVSVRRHWAAYQSSRTKRFALKSAESIGHCINACPSRLPALTFAVERSSYWKSSTGAAYALFALSKTRTLRLAIPNGSLQQPTIDLFCRAGYDMKVGGRSYYPTIADAEIECMLVRPQEQPRYVQDGLIDVGITGYDWIRETQANVVEIVEMVYSKVSRCPTRWVLVVPEASPVRVVSDLAGKRIATELVRLTQEFLEQRGVHALVEYSYGATEVKPPLLADAIVDATETGTSLRANSLRIVDTVIESTPRLIASPAAWADRMEAAEDRRHCTHAKGRDGGGGQGLAVDERPPHRSAVRARDPAAPDTPTVASLSDPAWVDITTIVDESVVRVIVPKLKKAGARGIVEYPLNKIIE